LAFRWLVALQGLESSRPLSGALCVEIEFDAELIVGSLPLSGDQSVDKAGKLYLDGGQPSWWRPESGNWNLEIGNMRLMVADGIGYANT
jgi:hypothetical protein